MPRKSQLMRSALFAAAALATLLHPCRGQDKEEGEEEEVNNYDDLECPTNEQLESENGYPLITQLDSSTVKVNWAHLWPSLERPSTCISEVKIVVDNVTTIDLENLDASEHVVEVEPCMDLEISVQIRVGSSDAFVESFVNSNNMTYKDPAFTENAHLDVDYVADPYGIIDLRQVQVKGSFVEIVHDYQCRRVETIELLVAPTGSEQWFISEYFDSIQDLEKTITLPANFCTGFDFALRLQGTFGTEDAQQVLATLGPVNANYEALKKAKQSGYEHDLGQMQNLHLVTSDTDSLTLQWDLTSGSDCFDGFMLVLEGTEQKQFTSKTSSSATFLDLEPCKQYFISGYLYMGDATRAEEQFLSSESALVAAKTMPDMTEPFALNTLKAKITKRTIRVAWDKDDLGSCISYKDLRVFVCEKYLQRGTCSQPPKTVQEYGEDMYKVEFNQLEPCTNYQLLIEHAHAPKVKKQGESQIVPEYALDDDSDDDYIMIDANGQIENLDAWGTLWYAFTTGKQKFAPKALSAMNETENSVTLRWKKDRCVSFGYSVTFASGDHKEESLDKFQQTIEGTKLARISWPDDAVKNDNVLISDPDWKLQSKSDEGSGYESSGNDFFADQEGSGEFDDVDFSELGSGDFNDVATVQGSGENSDENDEDDEGEESQDELSNDAKDWMTFQVDSLQACTLYSFYVSEVGENYTSSINAETLCDDLTTEALESMMTTELVPIEPSEDEAFPFSIADVKLQLSPTETEGTLMQLMWNMAPNVRVSGIIENRPSKFMVQKIFSTETNSIEEKAWFLNIPPCEKFNVSMKVMYLNGTSQVEWSESIKTMVNPEQSFDLANLSIDISAKSKRADAFIKWNHTFGCVDKYAIQVKEERENGLIGETILKAPEMTNQEVKQDLNLIPGLLTLKNCMSYSIWIYPESFPQDNAVWSQGVGKKFAYISPSSNLGPNLIDPHEATALQLTESSLSVYFDPPFICSKLDLKVVHKPYLLSNHSHDEEVVLHIDGYSSGREIDTASLLPCSSYRLELWEQEESPIVSKEFQTLKSDIMDEPLWEHEVVVWKAEESFDAISIEWSDKCQDAYRLDICQYPYNCTDAKEGFNYRTFEVSRSAEAHPKQTVTDLLPCALYFFEISNEDRSFLFFNNSFITDFSAEDFDLNLMDFDIIQAHSSLNVTWSHVNPCIAAYHVTVLDQELARVVKETKVMADKITDRASITPVYVYVDEKLEQCKSYEVIVKPLISVSSPTTQDLLDEDKRASRETVLLFTEPQPPKNLRVEYHDEKITTLVWDHLPCYEAYILQVYRSDDNQTEVFAGTVEADEVDGESVSKDLDNLLKPCTAYSFLVKGYSGEFGESRDATATVFFTSHAESIDMKGYASYHEITVDVKLHGVDCVSHYKLFLEDEDKNLHVIPVTTRGNVTVKNLPDGKTFTYELKGFDDAEKVTFSSKSFDIKTPINVTAEFTEEKSTDTSVTLSFHSSVFKHFDEKEIGHYVVLASCIDEFLEPTFAQASNTKSLTVKDLTPYTKYKCSGQFEFNGEFYEISNLPVMTKQGIPSEPRGLLVEDTRETSVYLKWDEPLSLNGVVEEYQILVAKVCDEVHTEETGHICSELCQSSNFAIKTKDSLVLVDKLHPWTKYEVKVSARTTHPEFGPFSESLKFETLPGDPNEPEIIKMSQTKRGGIMVDFNYPCPLTGPTKFHIGYKLSVADAQVSLGNVSQVVHRPLTMELVDLEGGHFYDIWIEACVGSDQCRASKEKVIEIECEHQCSDGTCLHWNAKCNYIRECPDGSDEFNCPCDPPLHFRCDNKYCIQSWRQCDGVNDCNDMSDEANCPSCVREDEFRCKESGECLKAIKTCDRKVDCRDGSDESGCPYWRTSCWPEKFRCLDHKCVDMKHRCDKIWDCQGGEDELSCNNGCANGGLWACRNRKECIAVDRYCDGVSDCEDGSDEAPECRCHKSGLYACKRGGQCVSRMNVCDGHWDCADGSDERNCRHIRNHTLNLYQRDTTKSGIYHEYSIIAARPKLKSASQVQLDVRVYPEKQAVLKHTDVVIQCRDESEMRARVKWSRLGGGPMPRHAKQHNGRLEIRKIGFKEGGIFLCTAVGHSHAKGSEKIASVDVMKRR